MTFPSRIRVLRSLTSLSLLLATAACELQTNPIPDAGEADAGEADCMEADAGEVDASVGDAGIACADPSQCPDPMNECLIATCDMGVCGIVAVANDTATRTGQLAGDCKRRVCDGVGNVKVVNDDNDPMDDFNDCTADTCSGGQQVSTPIAGTCAQSGGKVCGDPAGPNAGQCVECNVDADCPIAGYSCEPVGGTNTCVPATCSDGAQNGNETGVDCGGAPCGDCPNTPCQTGSDCQSGFCSANVCAPCSSHLDCVTSEYCDLTLHGGTCVADKPSGSTCSAAAECQIDICTNGVCCNGPCSVCMGMIGFTNPPIQRFTAMVDSGASAMGDLNGDGLPDLALTTYYSTDTIRLMANQGDGTFALVGSVNVGPSPTSIAIADLDANGHPDVAVSSYMSSSVAVLYNLGNWTFAPKVVYSTLSYPVKVVMGDINGDGFPDIMTTHSAINQVGVKLNQGNKTFGAATGYAANNPMDITATDLNGDGFADIAVTLAFVGLRVLFSNGNGTFASPVDYSTSYSNKPVPVDLNGDGWPDMALGKADGVDVLLNQGNGTLAAPIHYPTGFPISDVAVVDVDADNQLDVIASGNYYSGVSVFRNQGNGSLASAVTYATNSKYARIHAADFNQDGSADIAVVGSYLMEVMPNLGDGTFEPHVDAYPTAAPSSSIVAADFSGDGQPDVATGAGVFINQGNGVMGAEIAYPGGATFERVVAGDFNGDGTIDIAGNTSAEVQLMLNQGGALFASPSTILSVPFTGRYYALLTHDMNGDNLPDILAGREDWYDTFYCSKYCLPPNNDQCCDNIDWKLISDPVHILTNLGNGVFSGGTFTVWNNNIIDMSQYLWSPPKGLVAADFDADGLVDFARGDTVLSWDIQIWRNQGNGSFAPHSGFDSANPNAVSTFVAGYVNADKYIDLVDYGVRLNQGNGTFGAKIGFLSDKTKALADVSDDGVPDLVHLGSHLSVQRNIGGGNFGPEAHYATGGLDPVSVATADFNGDGKLDVAVMNANLGNPNGRTVSILLNECLP